MDSSSDQNEEEVQVTFPPFFRIFKSGRVHRFIGTSVVPPSADPAAPVLSKDVTIDSDAGISARLYIPNLNNNTNSSTAKIPILIYYHGGAFCVESAFSPTYHTFLNSVIGKSQILAVSVNYRLAPEHKLPAAYEDSWVALQWVLSGCDDWIVSYGDSRRIFVAGDSAGANIAHHMAVRASGGVAKIKGMVLIHPYFGKGQTAEATEGPGGEIWKVLSEMSVGDPRHNPTADGGMGMKGLTSELEKVMVCVAEGDFLKGGGVEYFQRLKGMMWGGEAEFVETEGEEHVFHLLKPGCDKGVELEDRIIAFISKE